MKNKKFNFLTLISSIVLSLLIGFGAAYATFAVDNILPGNATGLARFNKAYNDLYKNYYKNLNSDQLIDNAIKGMVSGLKDPYSQYITSSELESFNNNISGDVSGIGVMVKKNNNNLIIDSVIKDSPAEKSGIKSNDIITMINNEKIDNLDLSEVSQKIQGKTGTTVKLQLLRNNQTLTKKIVRSKITVSSIDSKVDENDKSVGYIKIKEFTDHTAKDLKKSLISLEKKHIKKVVIDLRQNPGGQLNQALLSASIFMKKGTTLMQMQERSGHKIVYKSKKTDNKGYKFTKPVALLVDENTASAAEVFSAALNENIKTPLIGTKTFGKGIVQTVKPVDGSSEIKYTSSKWLTPKGVWIHHKGITPTYKVDYDPIASTTFNSAKSFKLGQESKDIKSAQHALNYLGYSLEESGVLNDETSNALKEFQEENTLEATGILDSNTKEAIMLNLATKLSENDDMYKKAISVI